MSINTHTWNPRHYWFVGVQATRVYSIFLTLLSYPISILDFGSSESYIEIAALLKKQIYTPTGNLILCDEPGIVYCLEIKSFPIQGISFKVEPRRKA